MFICNRCGDLIEELPTIEERHPYGDYFASEHFTDDNCSCGGVYEEAVQCAKCGEWFTDDNVIGYQENICIDCANNLVDETNVKNFFSKNQDVFGDYIAHLERNTK